ncbi:Asp23/Gls24 family envelope stress response protein [Nocardia iowensis]|uniref:Asp23/Gls24 family envelope stress response protein n=1 Tax=Nocardia iowensis TaxID=204891 RepID=A0ABX8RWC6_NOCIO|nr:Asp23/Gls24 family envelope stress response protein [Nocardia iowensis]QXN93938.1 Asp23/Gls24 family envelope stress response protein [Nocardia iowensis]
MAVNGTTEQDYRLPCGREIEHVWDRLDAVEAGLGDEHEKTCPHCRSARDSLHALRAATKELIDEPEPAPPDLTMRIMSAVRAEARRGRTLSLPTPLPGTVEVSEQAVATVLRYAADSVPGVRARNCRVRSVGLGQDGAAQVEVELAVAIRFGHTTIGDALPIVRERVTAAVDAQIGLTLVALDLIVADIYHETGEAPR